MAIALAPMPAPASAPAARIVFPRAFAPTESGVPSVERAYRSEMSLNGTWRFEPEALPAGYVHNVGSIPELPAPTAEGWASTPIKIPSP